MNPPEHLPGFAVPHIGYCTGVDYINICKLIAFNYPGACLLKESFHSFSLSYIYLASKCYECHAFFFYHLLNSFQVVPMHQNKSVVSVI